MIKAFKNEHMLVPVKMWLDDAEYGALEQINNLSQLPFAFHHIAIMPDCHQGYGMPIGGVLATKKVVIPNAVGVDIGCGMCAVKTSLKADQLDEDTLKKIMGKIREVIPVGFKHHEKDASENGTLMPQSDIIGDTKYIVQKEWNNALTQIGTLGGGNHFIEIQKDTDNNVWIMIHSGSRNLGYTVAKHYNKIAIDLNEKWFSQVPKKHELAFLPIGSKEANIYLKEMQYCVDFALANRKLMMIRILDIFKQTFHWNYEEEEGCILEDKFINIAHNYARYENHFNENVIIHRKGATSARKGEIGIIPGSQGTKSYLVKGLGNPDSFNSCSHGAGRTMGRKQAKRTLDLKEEIKKLDKQGIIHSVRTIENLDEAPGAYKNIQTVMKNQNDLIEILVELTPLAVIKG